MCEGERSNIREEQLMETKLFSMKLCKWYDLFFSIDFMKYLKPRYEKKFCIFQGADTNFMSDSAGMFQPTKEWQKVKPGLFS